MIKLKSCKQIYKKKLSNENKDAELNICYTHVVLNILGSINFYSAEICHWNVSIWRHSSSINNIFRLKYIISITKFQNYAHHHNNQQVLLQFYVFEYCTNINDTMQLNILKKRKKKLSVNSFLSFFNRFASSQSIIICIFFSSVLIMMVKLCDSLSCLLAYSQRVEKKRWNMRFMWNCKIWMWVKFYDYFQFIAATHGNVYFWVKSLKDAKCW